MKSRPEKGGAKTGSTPESAPRPPLQAWDLGRRLLPPLDDEHSLDGVWVDIPEDAKPGSASVSGPLSRETSEDRREGHG